MKFSVRIIVGLRSGYTDPEGETTACLLKELGYGVKTVAISKVYNVVLEAESSHSAKKKAEDMCSRLLANPTKDTYTIRVEEEE